MTVPECGGLGWDVAEAGDVLKDDGCRHAPVHGALGAAACERLAAAVCSIPEPLSHLQELATLCSGLVDSVANKQ